MNRRTVSTFVICLLLLALAACTPPEDSTTLIVSLVVDGRERTYPQSVSLTVGEFLSQTDIELGALDEVTPPLFSQIVDGMRITVVRVQQIEECSQNEIPYAERRILNEGLQPGEERVAQPGQNGIEELCNRITIRDGQRMEAAPIRSTVIRAAQDAVIYIGPTGQLDPVQIEGTLYYLSNKNLWMMRGSSVNKRPLTTTGDIEGRVLSIASDGQRILFTRETDEAELATSFNRLWMLANTDARSEPVMLRPENILYADWVPGQENMISYSTGEITENAPGWQAYNDLWIARLDSISGELLNAREFVPRSTGWLYSWWGTVFTWSPLGDQLAWVRADSMGLIDLANGQFETLLTYPVFSTRQPWSWRADVSWSGDSSLVLTTVHGQPIGSEPAETSPVFHVAAAASDGSFAADVVRNAGIWSKPRYSPVQADGNMSIAYLRARDIANSISASAEYDLVVADSDGSNARVIYPPPDQPGLTADKPFFAWSPTGRQIALIYGGNLWVVDVQSGIAHALTLDRAASNPIWTQ
ncbi:MAG: G5 domain-containing protein [Anaerolineae bacterium]|nr:G5 domain-containing protein [Anaerolineae bacterium]